MVDTLLRCVRAPVIVAGCALVVAPVLLGGCARSIAGVPVPGAAATDSIPVAQLLIEPARFPERYPAAALDPIAVSRALQDIDGVGAASTVSPPQCAPPAQPAQAAAVRGIDSDTASSLIVAVTRGSPPLGGRAEQLGGCPSFTVVGGRDGPDTSAVSVTVLPAPPVNADDTYAVDQTVLIEPSGLLRRTRTLAAQVDDLRVSATWLHDGAPDIAPDTQALDAVFTNAVLKVRHAGGP